MPEKNEILEGAENMHYRYLESLLKYLFLIKISSQYIHLPNNMFTLLCIH